MRRSVVIVDDHTLFAHSLKVMVDSFEDYQVDETLANGQELISYFKTNAKKPDILLLDIKMPVMDGFETMSWLKENEPVQKVLALSMEDDDATVISMLRLGANGYLLKDIDPDEFQLALHTLVEEGYYHSGLEKKTFKGLESGKSDGLTEMELEFLRYACTELTYREIAGEMNRSPKTIDGYRESLFQKLGVKSRTGLAMFAIKHSLVTI